MNVYAFLMNIFIFSLLEFRKMLARRSGRGIEIGILSIKYASKAKKILYFLRIKFDNLLTNARGL